MPDRSHHRILMRFRRERNTIIVSRPDAVDLNDRFRRDSPLLMAGRVGITEKDRIHETAGGYTIRPRTSL